MKGVIKMTQLEKKQWFQNKLKEMLGKSLTYKLEPHACDDRFTSDDILDAYKENGCTIADYLTNSFYEDSTAEDYCLRNIEKRFYEEIKKSKEPQALKEYMENSISRDGYMNFIDSIGYRGMKINLNDYVDKKYRINLIFATDSEIECNMGSISTFFNSVLFSKYCPKNIEKYSDNALAWLINQQGYLIKDLCLQAKGKLNNEFLESICQEINNHTCSVTGKLTALCSGGGENFLENLQKIKNKKGNIVLPKDTTVGIFNNISGTGSLFKIKLEKPLIIPCSAVETLQFEDVKNENINTVGDMYAFKESYWNANLKVY